MAEGRREGEDVSLFLLKKGSRARKGLCIVFYANLNQNLAFINEGLHM